ncbi:MAG: response regulator [Acidobacteria bacterium]|nr:response regulator [Acidobacteriota bacterium]MCL5287919.1 response regulator [Acidobacteriota bacterium]
MAYSVLVVDDELLTLRTINRALSEEGFDVFVAIDGEKALEVFREEKPDLVLVDIVLPGLDGIEVLREIKQQSPATIVLMMSAYHVVERAVEAMKLGAYDYLVKPFHLADMVSTMKRAAELLALRVLEEGSFYRQGGTRPIRVDVRLLAATNRDLKASLASGEFREDLFYRLNVVPIVIPPLRERREDIVPLALDFLQHFNQELKRTFSGFSRAAAELLTSCPWPGNIRELKNVIERTMILSPDGEIDLEHLPTEIRDFGSVGDAREKAETAPAVALPSTAHNSEEHAYLTLRELEDRYIEEVLASVGNNKGRAARVLGIHPTSLLRRLKKNHKPAPPADASQASDRNKQDKLE